MKSERSEASSVVMAGEGAGWDCLERRVGLVLRVVFGS